MSTLLVDPEERCCVCGLPMGGVGPQKGLCDPCMDKFRSEDLAPVGHRCPLCGERRRRNLVLHEPSGEYICQPCQQAVAALPSWKQDIHSLRGAFNRRLGGD